MDQNVVVRSRDELLRNAMFDPVEYRTRYNAATSAPSTQLNLNTYKDFAEKKGLLLQNMDCCICGNNVQEVFSNSMKLYCMPQCQHTICSQCLVCMYAAEGSDSFKIVVKRDDGEEELETESFITKNSNYTYVPCPYCR